MTCNLLAGAVHNVQLTSRSCNICNLLALHGLGSRERLFYLAHLPPHSGIWFCPTQTSFQDALALRYNWQPLQAPSACACGMKFSIEHALSCPKSGFPALPHSVRMVQDWILLLMVFGVVDSNIPLRVFNPHAPSNRHPRCYRKHELEKKCHYEQ